MEKASGCDCPPRLQGEEGVTILPQWKTLFDAQPLSLNFRQRGNQAGEKMLMDGDDHLLIIIGDHGKDRWEGIHEMPNLVDNPDLHLGKLIRKDAPCVRSRLRLLRGIMRLVLVNSYGLANWNGAKKKRLVHCRFLFYLSNIRDCSLIR